LSDVVASTSRGWVRGRLGPAALVATVLAALLLAPSTSLSASVASPAVTASAGVLLDLATGRVLYEKNAAEERAPASLAKLMTLYLAYEDLRAGKVKLDDAVTITLNAERTPRYRMGVTAGQVVPFEILVAGVAIASANDAATAVADHLAGGEEPFVERMNAVALQMGLTHTHFANPHGLPDPLQRTTAHDMALLAQQLLQEYPESQDVLGQTGFTWRGRLYQRRIPLFRDPGGVDALKTGFTLDAGYNLAVAAGKAGNRLLCVILGAETRGLSFLDANRLLKFGFGEPVKEVRRVQRRFKRAPAVRPLARPVIRPVAP
jgi:serine-type D-Ala-D-Ala carboxypeptidase (penicillin-binding protein 5/6)